MIMSSSSCHISLFICSMILLIIVTGTMYRMQSSGPSEFKLPRKYGTNHNHSSSEITETRKQIHPINRKLLLIGECANRDISVSQSRDSTSGIPQYVVQIMNTCISGCAPREIRLHCGWFASERMVNPRTFKRISYDDCLVNAGKPLEATQIIRFTYSNTFMYPLSFRSAKFCKA